MSASIHRAGHSWDQHAGVCAALLILAAATGLQTGCTTYNDHFVYTPRPAQVTAPGGNQDDGVVRTLVSVIGLKPADERAGTPAAMEVRLRIRNDSKATVGFDPRSLTLVAANTNPFPQPMVHPSEPTDISAGNTLEISALFPIPDGKFPGDLDLRGLVVEWTATIGGRTVAQSASFRRLRIDPSIYHPYYYYPPDYYYSYPYYGPYYSPFYHRYWDSHRPYLF